MLLKRVFLLFWEMRYVVIKALQNVPHHREKPAARSSGGGGYWSLTWVNGLPGLGLQLFPTHVVGLRDEQKGHRAGLRFSEVLAAAGSSILYQSCVSSVMAMLHLTLLGSHMDKVSLAACPWAWVVS